MQWAHKAYNSQHFLKLDRMGPVKAERKLTVPEFKQRTGSEQAFSEYQKYITYIKRMTFPSVCSNASSPQRKRIMNNFYRFQMAGGWKRTLLLPHLIILD